MAKLSRFERSQRAHRRLIKKAYKDLHTEGKPIAENVAKFNYHIAVVKDQAKRGKLLSKSERKSIFKCVSWPF